MQVERTCKYSFPRPRTSHRIGESTVPCQVGRQIRNGGKRPLDEERWKVAGDHANPQNQSGERATTTIAKDSRNNDNRVVQRPVKSNGESEGASDAFSEGERQSTTEPSRTVTECERTRYDSPKERWNARTKGYITPSQWHARTKGYISRWHAQTWEHIAAN